MIELLAGCGALAVPQSVMAAVVQVESGGNRYAIGVVGGELERQPVNLREAVATAAMLEKQGYNYSLGAAQVNKKNFSAYGITSPEQAFDYCTSVRTGARILSECRQRAQNDWGKAFSCYYSGNFVTGFKDGYVQKVAAAWQSIPVQLRHAQDETVATSGAAPPDSLPAGMMLAQWVGPTSAGDNAVGAMPSGAPAALGGLGIAPPVPRSVAPPTSTSTSTNGAAAAESRSILVQPSAKGLLRGSLNEGVSRFGTKSAPASLGSESSAAGSVRAPLQDSAFVF